MNAQRGNGCRCRPSGKRRLLAFNPAPHALPLALGARQRDRKFNRGRASIRCTYGAIADPARATVVARVWRCGRIGSITDGCVMQATRRSTP